MTGTRCESFRFPKQRGFWLRCFLGAAIGVSPLVSMLAVSPELLAGQTVCVANGRACTPEESRAIHEQECRDEPAPPNLFVAHRVRLTGSFLDPSGAPIDFDSIKTDHHTVVQIKAVQTDEILFAVPLRANGEFEFESVPEGTYRLILVWMKDGAFARLPLADQPKKIECSDSKECSIRAVLTFHGSDNPIDTCPPK